MVFSSLLLLLPSRSHVPLPEPCIVECSSLLCGFLQSSSSLLAPQVLSTLSLHSFLSASHQFSQHTKNVLNYHSVMTDTGTVYAPVTYYRQQGLCTPDAVSGSTHQLWAAASCTVTDAAHTWWWRQVSISCPCPGHVGHYGLQHTAARAGTCPNFCAPP